MDDFFTAYPGLPVRVEMSPNAASTLHWIVQSFADRCRRFDSTLRGRMFPDTAPEPEAFRQRHQAGMHQAVLDATERVLASWAGHPQVLLDQAAVDDWFIVLAHARWLYVDGTADDVAQWAHRGVDWAVKANWLQFVQDALCSAAMPELSGFSHPGNTPPTQ